MITPYVPLVLRENLEKVGKPRHKKKCRGRICVSTTWPSRPKVPTFGCRADMSPTCRRLSQPWNSCPIPGTDISRSLVAVGREFAFPIDYSTNKHWELTSSPTSAESYSRDLATGLSALREVTHLLVKEHRAYHCELRNSHHPDQCTYSVGDIVFARRATRSDAAKGRVDKLTYAFTGPWHITALPKGASYELEHCSTPNRKEMKHASDLSPYPVSATGQFRHSVWTATQTNYGSSIQGGWC